ncbi:Transcriptional regulator PadR-like family protein [Halorientalis persicus]|uniref:Transcriptional regulator PadR-like family protein n=1 Tax=Halorientalis persicus TaxID=1367881 RepID=A0A1H8X0T3_9EURY|nr:helix-turn-helix transcriptional regulator [Halorientalis persicus]SEP33565.1 Transcriptional regulator PadR-like family protein [Halorientalis persicus]
MSKHDTKSASDVSAKDLSAFKKEALFAIARLENSDETPYGLGIKRQLQERLDEEINHGRLYPNLDDLVGSGLLEKEALDKRTNTYTLTEEGKELLRDYRDYVDETVSTAL